MSVYLIEGTFKFRCDTEAEATQLIKEAKENGFYVVKKTTNEIKNTKSKGEIIDEWRRVVITQEFTSEKEPTRQVSVSYEED